MFEVPYTLLDENNAPYDLSTTEVKWVLLDRSAKRVFDNADVGISIIDAAQGQCAIMIPATATTKLVAGSYSDVIRVVAGGITSTLAEGPIYVVMADPWAVQPAAQLHTVFERRKLSAA